MPGDGGPTLGLQGVFRVVVGRGWVLVSGRRGSLFVPPAHSLWMFPGARSGWCSHRFCPSHPRPPGPDPHLPDLIHGTSFTHHTITLLMHHIHFHIWGWIWGSSGWEGRGTVMCVCQPTLAPPGHSSQSENFNAPHTHTHTLHHREG